MATHTHRPESRKHVGLTLALLFAVSILALVWRGGVAEFTWAAFAGMLPALFWLWFWIREDRIHPEPKRAIFKAFLFGALTVPIAIVFEQAFDIGMRFLFGFPQANSVSIEMLPHGIILVLFAVWALVEEVLKYRAADISELRTKLFDEPIDAPIYLISAALGFTAFENGIFVWTAILDGGVANAILTTHLRFLGASLLHVVSSSIIGFAVGFSFYKSMRVKKIFLGLGLLTAVLLHALFNYLILIGKGGYTFGVFISLWIITAIVFIIFEKIKKFANKQPSL